MKIPDPQNEERARHLAIESELVSASAQRLAEIEELHLADRLMTLGRMASLAHELGTPLAVVQARAQMIAGVEGITSDVARDVEAIVAQTLRMAAMVREIMSMAEAKSCIAPVSLNRLVAQTIALMKPLCHPRGVTMEVARDAQHLSTLGDASRLLQVLANLTVKARQSMPNGGVITFQVGQRRATPPGGAPGDYLFVEVCDQGGGSGTDLGLSLSDPIARAHGGFIDVDRTSGKRTCFTLYLPHMAS